MKNNDKELLEKKRKIWNIATALGIYFSAQDIVLATKHPEVMSILCLAISVSLTAYSGYRLNEINKKIKNNDNER